MFNLGTIHLKYMTHFTNALYGKKLKNLRNQMDATQASIAADLNMSQQAYGKLERGKTNFTVERVHQICAIFHIAYNEFVIVEDSLLQKSISKKTNKAKIEDLAMNEINKHYEFLFIESELRNIKLEQKIRNYIPYKEVSKEDAKLIYVMI